MRQPSNQVNQVFSLPRFGRLFSRHTAEHWSSYAMAAAVLAGLLALLLGITAYQLGGTIPVGPQGGFFTLFMVLAGTMFTSNVFAQFGERRQATVALLLPASHLEKYLVAWLYSLPLFLLVFTGVFYLVDAAVLYAGAGPGQQPEFFNVVATDGRASNLFWTLALLHGAWLWGAIYFEKTHFIKTGFGVFVLLGALVFVNFQALKGLLGAQIRFAPPFSGAMLVENGQDYSLTLPAAQTAWLGLVPVTLAALLWLAAYFRVTEKQL